MSNSILYKELQQNWKILEDKLNRFDEGSPNLEIGEILLRDDSLYIEKISAGEFKIVISFRLSIENEFSFIKFTSKMIMIKQLGFVLDKRTTYSSKSNELTIYYVNTLRSIEEVKELIEKIGKKIRGFKASIELKDDALFVYTDGNLSALYPYISSVEPPNHPKIKKIVDKMVDAYYIDYISKDKSEVDWGVRTALQMAKELLKCSPEVIYRILRGDSPKYRDLMNELYKYLEIIPYSGPGRRSPSKSASCGMAFRIKRENPYVSKLLRQLGVSLKIIYPGG